MFELDLNINITCQHIWKPSLGTKTIFIATGHEKPCWPIPVKQIANLNIKNWNKAY
jgi:hypothetical protein